LKYSDAKAGQEDKLVGIVKHYSKTVNKKLHFVAILNDKKEHLEICRQIKVDNAAPGSVLSSGYRTKRL
jgi:hypothetical protein